MTDVSLTDIWHKLGTLEGKLDLVIGDRQNFDDRLGRVERRAVTWPAVATLSAIIAALAETARAAFQHMSIGK